MTELLKDRCPPVRGHAVTAACLAERRVQLDVSPALSEEMLLVRGTSHLFAVGRGGQQPQEPVKAR
ncbi:MAG: hypothetical protein O7C74_07620 [Acidobacteria bacterium]|nr:hypothetical protein [Acidobacteriota bacterium]